MKAGFVSETVIALYCNVCGQPYEDDEGPTMFSTIEEAVSYVRGPYCNWETDGETVTCDHCIAVRQCQAQGHVWQEWYTYPLSQGGAPGMARARFCDVCRARESGLLP